jgi:hypothetical protein
MQMQSHRHVGSAANCSVDDAVLVYVPASLLPVSWWLGYGFASVFVHGTFLVCNRMRV